MSTRTFEDKARAWAWPVIMAVVLAYGQSFSSRFDSIEDKIDTLMEYKSGNLENVKGIESRIEKLERKVFSLSAIGLLFQIAGINCELPPHPTAIIDGQVIII